MTNSSRPQPGILILVEWSTASLPLGASPPAEPPNLTDLILDGLQRRAAQANLVYIQSFVQTILLLSDEPENFLDFLLDLFPSLSGLPGAGGTVRFRLVAHAGHFRLVYHANQPCGVADAETLAEFHGDLQLEAGHAYVTEALYESLTELLEERHITLRKLTFPEPIRSLDFFGSPRKWYRWTPPSAASAG